MTDSGAQPFAAHMDVAGRVADIAGMVDRPDLAGRLRVAIARTARPATIICVVGEFKQGKSSLVNALLGQHVCPVDDDLATSAITLVRQGDEPAVEVRRRVDNELVVEQVPPDEIADSVTEFGNPENAKNVERVDVSAPSPLLADGLCIVDTPGMGSMGAGHAAATLAFLPFADGLVFASDASAELSEPEVEAIAGMGSVSDDVLRIIGNNRQWMKNYTIVLRLCKNSKTPLGLSMNLMNRLQDADLTRLSVDRNVPESLRAAARKKVTANRG
jgi:hypothetical protein